MAQKKRTINVTTERSSKGTTQFNFEVKGKETFTTDLKGMKKQIDKLDDVGDVTYNGHNMTFNWLKAFIKEWQG